MINQFRFFTIAGLFLLAILFVTCKKEKENDEETITTVVLQPTSGPTSAVFTWEDKEGDGNPTIDTVRLSSGSTTSFDIQFFDRSGTTSVELTDEIESEDTDHLVVYLVSNNGRLSVATADLDTNGKPLGLKSNWTAIQSGNESVKILLKHQPDKSAADPSLTGDTDIEVTFPVKIQ